MHLTPYALIFLFGEGSKLTNEPGFLHRNGRFLGLKGFVGISFTLRNPHIALFVSSFHRHRRRLMNSLHVNDKRSIAWWRLSALTSFMLEQ
jgi:hypothetical protein